MTEQSVFESRLEDLAPLAHLELAIEAPWEQQGKGRYLVLRHCDLRMTQVEC